MHACKIYEYIKYVYYAICVTHWLWHRYCFTADNAWVLSQSKPLKMKWLEILPRNKTRVSWWLRRNSLIEKKILLNFLLNLKNFTEANSPKGGFLTARILQSNEFFCPILFSNVRVRWERIYSTDRNRKESKILFSGKFSPFLIAIAKTRDTRIVQSLLEFWASGARIVQIVIQNKPRLILVANELFVHATVGDLFNTRLIFKTRLI